MTVADLAESLGPLRCFGCTRPGALVCRDCRDCLGRASVAAIPGIDRVIAAWDYDGAARSLVLALKLRGRRPAATELGRAIADRVWEHGTGAEAITWVPGRRGDIRRRGYDHAEAIARVVAARLGLPAARVLTRTGDRIDQTMLGAAARRKNLRGAFVAHTVPGRIAVVDDLVTTGATLSEAARALRAAGAGYVEGLAACSVS